MSFTIDWPVLSILVVIVLIASSDPWLWVRDKYLVVWVGDEMLWRRSERFRWAQRLFSDLDEIEITKRSVPSVLEKADQLADTRFRFVNTQVQSVYYSCDSTTQGEYNATLYVHVTGKVPIATSKVPGTQKYAKGHLNFVVDRANQLAVIKYSVE